MKKSMKKLLVMSMVGAMLMGSAPAVIANAEEATTETTTEVTTEQTDTTEASKTETDKKKPAKPQKVSVSKATCTSAGKVNISFRKNVSYASDLAVKIIAADGNTYDAKIAGKSKGNIKVSVSKLEKGKKYTVVINGVKGKKEANFGSISTTFVTKDKDKTNNKDNSSDTGKNNRNDNADTTGNSNSNKNSKGNSNK